MIRSRWTCVTDSQGRPTDDPDVGFKGFLLLDGRENKGLGLA